MASRAARLQSLLHTTVSLRYGASRTSQIAPRMFSTKTTDGESATPVVPEQKVDAKPTQQNVIPESVKEELASTIKVETPAEEAAASAKEAIVEEAAPAAEAVVEEAAPAAAEEAVVEEEAPPTTETPVVEEVVVEEPVVDEEPPPEKKGVFRRLWGWFTGK